MQTFNLKLTSEASTSFHAIKARNSVDLSDDSKLCHKINIENADVETPYNVGLIIGASGSGKTTLAKSIFKNDFFDCDFDKSKAVIDQFPDDFDYDKRSNYLNAIGLSQVPCWIKPLGILSNGQQERAKVALTLSQNRDLSVFDEWTSVVDRNVAAVMSHTAQKMLRKNNKKAVFLSCHYDVVDWLDPDWIIDCNEQMFTNRRELVGQERKKKMCFSIRKVDKKTWRRFSKYHYLSEALPGGLTFSFGLFLDDVQIGYQNFAEYTPYANKKAKRILHSNRTVIHPDYVGFGLGMKLINETSKIMVKDGYRVMGKFSSLPVYKAMSKDKKWVLKKIRYFTSSGSEIMLRISGFRDRVKTWSFEYVGEK